MKLKYYCGCYNYKSPISLFVESAECEAEGEIETDVDDWEQECVSITCPKCGAELH